MHSLDKTSDNQRPEQQSVEIDYLTLFVDYLTLFVDYLTLLVVSHSRASLSENYTLQPRSRVKVNIEWHVSRKINSYE